jgi:hypothetical protein
LLYAGELSTQELCARTIGSLSWRVSRLLASLDLCWALRGSFSGTLLAIGCGFELGIALDCQLVRNAWKTPTQIHHARMKSRQLPGSAGTHHQQS